MNDGENYADAQYWDARFEQGVRWQWFFGFDVLQPLLELHLEPLQQRLRVLEVGCGDAPILGDVVRHFDVERAVGIDFAPKLLRQMKKEHKASDIEFVEMDAREMTFDDESFNFVFDKATMDAMLGATETEIGLENARRLLAESTRVLAAPGVMSITTHLNPLTEQGLDFISSELEPILSKQFSFRWIIHAHIQEDDDQGPCTYMIEKTKPRETRRKRTQADRHTVQLLVHEH